MFLGCSPCCDPCQIDWANVDSVTLTMRSDGHYVNNTEVVRTAGSISGQTDKYSYFDFIAGFNGTLVLSRTQHNVQLDASVFGAPRIGSVWSLDLGGEPGCPAAVVEYQVAHAIGNPSFLSGRTVAAIFMTRTRMTIIEIKAGPLDTTSSVKDCTEDVAIYSDASAGCSVVDHPPGISGAGCKFKNVTSNRFSPLRVVCQDRSFGFVSPEGLSGQQIYREQVQFAPSDEISAPIVTVTEQNEPIVYLEQISITSPNLDLTLSP